MRENQKNPGRRKLSRFRIKLKLPPQNISVVSTISSILFSSLFLSFHSFLIPLPLLCSPFLHSIFIQKIFPSPSLLAFLVFPSSSLLFFFSLFLLFSLSLSFHLLLSCFSFLSPSFFLRLSDLVSRSFPSSCYFLFFVRS